MFSEQHTWNILGDHFKKKGFVHHQIGTFDHFINVGIHTIITEEPEILLNSKNGKNPGSFTSYKVSFSNVHVPSPTVTEDSRILRGFYPSEARQRDLTYDSPIYATVTETLEIDGKEPEINQHIRVVLGRIPIMLRSSKCYLSKMTPEETILAGECKYDQGGYFIVKGKERVLISQLRGVYNKPLVIEQKPGDKYAFSCDMRSMSEETGHSVLISAVIGTDDRTLSFYLPYIKDPIPIGVVFKAMGYRSDQFADLIGLSCDKVEKYVRLIINDSFFVEEQTDGFAVFAEETQEIIVKNMGIDESKITPEIKKRINEKLKDMWKIADQLIWKTKSTRINALKYIGQHTNHPIKECDRKDYAEQVVDRDIFPHMGVTCTTKEKAYLLGHMVHKLLATFLGFRKADDRDNYINKRIESPGVLCHELFRQLFKKYIGTIISTIEKKKQLPDVMSIIPRLTDITKGFNHCFGTGNWGVPKNSYVRPGVAQILSRLSYGATLSNLRRVSIPVGKESKNAAIRQINPSQIMYICPVETPEGAPVGIVLNLSLMTCISDRTPTVLVKEIVELCENMSHIGEFDRFNEQTKVFLNGILLGVSSEPNSLVDELKEFRRIKMIPWDVSISYDSTDDEINICSDEGRLLRPVFKVLNDKLVAEEKDGTDWDYLVENDKIVYIDNMEANGSVIAFNEKELVKYKNDYCEISPAMMLGVMASIIPFPDHSQCIFKDEPVYMANGTVKKISDVQVGDEVITFHPETQQQSITKVSHTYTNKTDKQLFEITTISGRKIIATFDHRFMTFDGWKRIEEIEVGKTLVGVSTEPKPVSNLVDDYVILTKEQFIERCLNAQIEDYYAIKYASEISFPIKSTDTNLYIISRLFGFVCTESCYICLSSKDDVRLNVFFTDKNSSILFNEDVERLGFNYSKKEVVDFYCIEYFGAFAALFIALSCNNIIQEGQYKRLSYWMQPYWIKNCSDLVKREFLAGFHGGYGSKIRCNSDNLIHIDMSVTTNVIQETESLMEFMNYIVELLLYFKIKTSKAKYDKDKMTVSYQICDLPNNLIDYFNIIGYRYDVNKNIESGIYVEYLKYLENKLQDNKIGLLSPTEWLNLVKWKSTTLFIPLESKIESLETIISDITTESTNQSFLCGDTFCVHNSPRNCYQCLDPETLVVMADNTKKAIKDIKIGDSVVSVDPITCVQTTTKVINQYVRETEKEIITVETESGRKITCTVDHPVLTTDGWKHAIDAENICVIPQQVVYSGGDEDLYITLPETSVKEKHINDLTSIGLYPIKSTSLPILARIVGYLITNGSTSLYDKRPQVKFNFYSIEDCEDFLKDLHELGFSPNKVIDVDKIIDVIIKKYGKCKQIIYNNAFASLLIGLVDGYVGKRTTQSYPPLMNWIKNGSMLVKREFVSGFQGGNKLTGVTSTKFLFNHISLPSRVDYVNSLLEFMKEIKVLFEEFDIECSGPFLIKKSQHSQSDDVHLYFKNTTLNHINYFEKIGWRYNIFKYLESLTLYEYQKTCQKAIDDIIVERQIIKKYIEDSMTIRQISDKLNKTYQYISDSVRSIEENRDPRIPNSFESWKRQVKDRAIFVKIVSKTRLVNKVNMIADITTESENHSFIAGDSFCVHNSSMGKQAMSMFALSHLIRADTVVHVMNTPHRPLVGTKAAEMMGFNDMPSGVNCIVAIACYTGFNQEDSVILNYSAVQRGLFWATTYKTHSDEEKKQGYNAERIGVPPLDKRKHDANYGLLDENGVVRIRQPKWTDKNGVVRGGGSVYVQKGDVIIGKVSIQSDKCGNEILTDCSMIIGKGEDGYIDRIFTSITPNGYKLIKVVIRSLRIPEVGDKFASRAAQKGTVGMVYRQEDMPFTQEGIVPDIIINPHCLADDHEILTEHGFMNWKEAKEGYDQGTLRIAGYDHKTGHLVYEYPTAFILNESKTQEMIEFIQKDEKVSLLVTTDHDMFVKELESNYKKVKAHELLSSDVIKFTGKTNSGMEGCIKNIPFLELLYINTYQKLMAFCELYGYWLSEGGSIGFLGNSLEMYTDKLLHDEWLRDRFNILGLVLSDDYTYSVSRSSNMNKYWRSHWSIINKNWINTLSTKKDNKYIKLISEWVWNLPSSLSRLILSGIYKKEDCNVILTKCSVFRDKIMRLAINSGYSCHFEVENNFWKVSYTNTSEHILDSNNDVKKVQYTGLTWCVTMPHGFIITRRSKRDSNNIVVEASRPIITGQCIPSRMTINQLIESVMGKSCAIDGKYGDATPFTEESKNVTENACKLLGMNGYESTGKEILMNGMTGEQMGMFFIGPVYYQRLKHLVSDKMHARATGPVTTLTRQPLEGRSRDGGQRFGEMERDCFCSVPIPLNCGLSVKIETMEKKDYSVLSYDERKQQVIPSRQSNFLYKGERECVDVVFQDGRTIRGTDNHKILTSDNTWIPINEAVIGVTQIKTCITNPLIDVKEEIEKCRNWKFQAGNTKIEITDDESYFRSLSFARLVGYICADGGIYYISRTKTYTGVINLGHEIDVTCALEDLEKFCIIKQQVFISKNYYSIRIPQNFVEDLMTVKGMIIGKKVNQAATLPTFITDSSCPLPIVREFLAGLFGADGHTCVLALHRGKRDLLTSISFSKSKIKIHMESLEKMMEQLKTLLARFEIHNVTIQKAKEITSSKKKVDSLEENKSYQLTLHICIDDLPMFHEKIGFRYCCHKSQRLEAGASYKRLRDGVTRQHNWLVQRVDELTQFSKIKKEFPNKIVHTKKAIQDAIKDLNKTEALLHEYAIPSTHDINDHLVKGTSFGKFRGKGFPNAEEYLKDIGALDWFLQDEPVKSEETSELPPSDDTLVEDLTNLNVSYGVNRRSEGLPTMNLRVIDIRPAGVHPVYDIQVDDTHTFLANGIVAHNCMIGHGVSKFLQERLFIVSDKYQVSICNKCGNFATSKTECKSCDTDQVVSVKLPYVGKLVIQELNAMMIKTKITAK
jgi:DNA-directed RNA polymerase beta subunit/intein/homing endonuclease